MFDLDSYQASAFENLDTAERLKRLKVVYQANGLLPCDPPPRRGKGRLTLERMAKPREEIFPEPIVHFSAGAEEEPVGEFAACPLSQLIRSWATRYDVDEDLALLLCASTAAHTAGPLLHFEGGTRYEHETPAPTVFAAAEDEGFYRAIQAATQSLYPIQRELLEKYGEAAKTYILNKKAQVKRDDLEDPIGHFRRLLQAQNGFTSKDPTRDMNIDQQQSGPVRFLLEGALPARPFELLKECHLYNAMSVGEIEELPRSPRCRYERISRIAALMNGYRASKVAIRGFMRLPSEGIESIMSEHLYLLCYALPMESPGQPLAVPKMREAGEAEEFDRLHRMALRRVLEMRFGRAECGAEFRSEEAKLRFQALRETYRAQSRGVSHILPASVILPDLFVWYLLQLGKSDWLKIDEIEIAEYAIAVARRLRRRSAAYYDRHVAVLRARKRVVMAGKLVARMSRLAKPCKRRDLARGLDKQKMVVIDPLIDSLIDLGVFTTANGWLRLGKASVDAALNVEDFMEPLTDVPYSLTRWLDTREGSAQGATETPTHPQDSPTI